MAYIVMLSKEAIYSFNKGHRGITIAEAELASVMNLVIKKAEYSNANLAKQNNAATALIYDDGITLINKSRISTKMLSRLSYAGSAFKVLAQTTEQEMKQAISKLSFISPRFSARKIGKIAFSEKQLGSLIWDSMLKKGLKPEVCLNSEENAFYFISLDSLISPVSLYSLNNSKQKKGPIKEKGNLKEEKHHINEKKIAIAKKIWSNKRDFLQRKPHLRPGQSPVSLEPRLARACINLVTAKKQNTIVDPFCGTGGILIEAVFLGHKAVGYDISSVMLKKAEANLKHYKLKGYTLEKRSALGLSSRYSYIVTDLPYGLNTGKLDKSLYKSFFLALKKAGIKKAVIITPDFIPVTKEIKSFGFRVLLSFRKYIHKSLTKIITLIHLDSR